MFNTNCINLDEYHWSLPVLFNNDGCVSRACSMKVTGCWGTSIWTSGGSSSAHVWIHASRRVCNAWQRNLSLAERGQMLWNRKSFDVDTGWTNPVRRCLSCLDLRLLSHLLSTTSKALIPTNRIPLEFSSTLCLLTIVAFAKIHVSGRNLKKKTAPNDGSRQTLRF